MFLWDSFVAGVDNINSSYYVSAPLLGEARLNKFKENQVYIPRFNHFVFIDESLPIIINITENKYCASLSIKYGVGSVKILFNSGILTRYGLHLTKPLTNICNRLYTDKQKLESFIVNYLSQYKLKLEMFNLVLL